MAKLTLKIDGKNKVFVKNKLNLGAMKAQAEFDRELQNAFGEVNEMQEIYRKNRKIINQSEKIEQKITDAETQEEAEEYYKELDELEETEEFRDFMAKVDELNKKIEEQSNDESFELYDEFASLLVKVFDNQFTVDEVFDGLEVENNLAETYNKIFSSNDTGKQKKKASTTKTKQQTKS